jgi:meckelin
MVYPLMFFVITFVFFGIGWVLYGIQIILKAKFPPDFVNFIDLCAVANISIMIFNEDLRGHYIHGKSPNGTADVGSEQLRL